MTVYESVPHLMRPPVLPLFFILAVVLHAAEPAGAFRPWSAVKKFDLEKLAHGKIATECNGSIEMQRISGPAFG